MFQRRLEAEAVYEPLGAPTTQDAYSLEACQVESLGSDCAEQTSL